jgi:hypothetical protein
VDHGRQLIGGRLRIFLALLQRDIRSWVRTRHGPDCRFALRLNLWQAMLRNTGAVSEMLLEYRKGSRRRTHRSRSDCCGTDAAEEAVRRAQLFADFVPFISPASIGI